MSAIQVVDRHVIYENPSPNTCGQHGSFPGLVSLGDGELVGLFVLGTDLEAADATTFVTRSKDHGRTWKLEGPLHRKDAAHCFDADALKPTRLPDGRLMAIGYRFHRRDPAEALVNAGTGGVRPGDDLVSFSTDRGLTWSPPARIPRPRPELIEVSGPAVVLSDGSLVAVGSLFPTWEGAHPSGNVGVLLRSGDDGRTWDDGDLFFVDVSGRHLRPRPACVR